MKTKFLSLLIACFVVTTTFSQSNLNSYKYVIVPNKFDFLKEKDQYQLNSLTKFLFEKYGFLALMEGDTYPDDLTQNRCLALKSDVLKDSGMFKTKLAVEFKDCNDKVVLLTENGESREKDYAKAYTEALRNAFKQVEVLNYAYVPSKTNATTVAKVETTNTASEIEKLKAEIEALKQKKEEVIEIVEVKEVVEEQPAQMPIKIGTTLEPKIEVKETKTLEAGVKEVLASVLYAQEIENGYQLVDSTPKVIYKIKKTSIKDVFLVENKDATLYKKEGNWILEFYENNALKQQVLNIKF